MNEITLVNRRKDYETREVIDSLLSGFESKETKKYWLNILVKLGSIPESRAGQIIIERGL